jgi:hypothetical protein
MHPASLVMVALTVLGAAQPPDLTRRFLVIVATESSEQAAQQRLEQVHLPSAFVLRTDLYQGLRPGLFAVVDSLHSDAKTAAARCRKLEQQEVACYVRRVGAPAPSHEVQAALGAVPGRGDIDFAGRLETSRREVALVVVSYPLQKPIHGFLPVARDRGTSVFLFAGAPGEAPLEIRDHSFLQPGDAVWEDIQCGAIRLLPLGNAPLPATLAQHCTHQGDSEFRYLLFDEGHLQSPVKGMATWSLSVYPDTTHELFVPNDDPQIPGGISSHQGDGKTVVDATEGKKAGPAVGRYIVRQVTTEWTNGELVIRRGPWRDPEGD